MKRTPYAALLVDLERKPRTWLVTGAAGFIGSNLVETLLRCDQNVVGLDNFTTGHRRNLVQVRKLVGREAWRRFRMVEGDITDARVCRRACKGVQHVLHQAALGSVPRSIEEPLASHACNVTGFVNMLLAARDAGVPRVVYASSSAVYGDHPGLPKVEDRLGEALSPYAATKLIDELYAAVFARCYDLETVGLRYFNVFGERQDPDGPYAAVIPRWIAAMLRKQSVSINGDGKTSRDFCYIANVVQANLLAATTPHHGAANQVYNVALNSRTSLNGLFELLRAGLEPHCPHLRDFKPTYRGFRAGDVRHSQADVSKAEHLLGYRPTHSVAQGLEASLEWYRSHLG